MRKLGSAINPVRKSETSVALRPPRNATPSNAYDTILSHTHVQARVPGHMSGYNPVLCLDTYSDWAKDEPVVTLNPMFV